MASTIRIALPETSGWSIQQFPGGFGVGVWTILANAAGEALHWFEYAPDRETAKAVLRDVRAQMGV